MDPDIHVGLGAQPVIDSLIVQWPDGALQKSYEIAADTVYSLTRPSTGKIGQIPYISRFGVILFTSHPYAPTELYPKSSAVIKSMLGSC